jgi:hypothetical protein
MLARLNIIDGDVIIIVPEIQNAEEITIGKTVSVIELE